MRIFVMIIFFIFFQVASLEAAKIYNKPAYIFASGNLKFIFPQILQSFYAKYPQAQVRIQYASSGVLAQDILEGKAYDIYFSANRAYPEKIYRAHKSAIAPKNYAQGLLVLFVPSNSLLAKRNIKILKEESIHKISIANKKNAPYGVAALEVLQSAKCCKGVFKKIRYVTDVQIVIDDVIWHGNAGFLSKSALSMLPKDRKKEGMDWIEINPKLYSPIIQAYVVSKEGLKNKNARQFLDFLESKEGQKIFRENGYKNILK